MTAALTLFLAVVGLALFVQVKATRHCIRAAKHGHPPSPSVACFTIPSIIGAAALLVFSVAIPEPLAPLLMIVIFIWVLLKWYDLARYEEVLQLIIAKNQKQVYLAYEE
jgi:uncharacterized membrane protein YfcA